MAIRTGKSFKVAEQSTDGDGCSTILASFSEAKHGERAHREACNKRDDLARQNPGTRFYVLETTSGVYVDGDGMLREKTL